MLTLYSVYDNKSEAHSHPLAMLNYGQVVSTVLKTIYESGGKIEPKHVDVFELGSYDQDTGKIIVNEFPKHLFNGATIFKRLKEAEAELEKQNKKEVTQ